MMVATRSVHVPGVGACAKGAVLADDEALVAAAPKSFAAVLEAKPKRARKVEEPEVEAVEPGPESDEEAG